MPAISLELNELNFHYIESYVADGRLPTFGRLLRDCQLFETIAENQYPHLEPWIQWPTVYTGKTFAQHGIFRLGDAVYKPHIQIWERLECHRCKVGAISPMNAANRCAHPDFFLPDPWTNTPSTADRRTEKLFCLVRDAVINNASSDLSTFGLGRQILSLALPYLNSSSFARFLAILPTARKHKWAKAAFLDALLADLFLSLVAQHGTQYASLFLNAAAHIQHHHTYDSAVYQGERRNPAWYSSAAGNDVDPLLFIYGVYDRILAQFLAQPNFHLLITTGLSQVPNERNHYQYRIVDFDGFMTMIGLEGVRVEPRMSRDFLLVFESAEAARTGVEALDRIVCRGKPLLNLEDRGETLFCQVAYFGPPEGLKEIAIDSVSGDYSDKFVLVSIENAIHQTIGYHVDNRIANSGEVRQIPLTEVHGRLQQAGLAELGEAVSAAA